MTLIVIYNCDLLDHLFQRLGGGFGLPGTYALYSLNVSREYLHIIECLSVLERERQRERER